VSDAPNRVPPLVSLVQPSQGTAASFSPAEQQVLDLINQKVAAAESLEQLIDFLFDAVQPIFDCDRVGVSFVEEGGARLIAHYARTAYEPVLLKKGYSEELAGSSLQAVIQGGTPRILRDLERYLAERPQSRSTKVLVREGVRSSMTCPLLVEGRVAALLFFSSRRPDAYTEHHVHLHLAIAERLAQAVEKARRIEELAQANRAYLEMLGFVSHELKNPLASIVMDASLLTGGYIGTLDGEQRRVVDRMVRKAEFLLNVVREYLDLARIEGGELSLRPREGVDIVQDVLEAACDIVKALADEKRMRIERVYPDAPVRLTCDPDLLRIVAVNLVGNAIKYGRDQGRVRVSAGGSGPAAWFTVWNEGPGFPAALRPRLFRKFSRLDTPELRSRKGTGVGLYTSWKIVQLHGGRIDATSEEGAWAEFRVDLPLAAPAPASV
jgi:signal transduction histidine kinase